MLIVNGGEYPSYSLPTQEGTGNVTIGTVSNLRYPDNYPQLKMNRTDRLTVTGGKNITVHSRDPYSISPLRAKRCDTVSTGLQFRLNESKTAALLDYITNDNRGADFTFTAGTGYPFGLKNGSGSFTSKFISSRFSVKHERYNDFRITLEIGKQP
jgi:hypothetical protein